MTRLPMLRPSTLALALLAASLVAAPAAWAGSNDQPVLTPAATAPAEITPQLAGARYGQAAGVALVCYGMKTTPAVADLKARYSGESFATFNAAAEKVLAAWRDMQTCVHAGGPNQCRLTTVWSCRDAMREIGPGGSALAGLVEVK